MFHRDRRRPRTHMKTFKSVIFFAATLATVASATAADIVDTAIGAGNFKTLITAVQKAGLESSLRKGNNLTVFAPTDAAFAALPKGTLEKLIQPNNKGALTQILTFHVLPKEVLGANLDRVKSKTNFETLNGANLTFEKRGAKIGNARIVTRDILTDNGVIHVIDAVLLPPNLPKLNDAEASEARADGNLVEVAQGAGQFKTLIKAVQTAGLAKTLMGDGPFTVFAPNDEAFAKLGHTVSDLLKPENRGTLTSILTYHVLPTEVLAANVLRLQDGAHVKTVNGKTVRIRNKGTLRVNNSRIIATDFLASNGVIHVIDSVLMPH